MVINELNNSILKEYKLTSKVRINSIIYNMYLII